MVAAFYFFGIVAGVIAAYFAHAGLTMDTAVATGTGDDFVSNFQLMHVQSENLSIAIGMAIIAAVLISAGGIIEAIQKGQIDEPPID